MKHLGHWLLVPALLALLAHPVAWLAHTWVDDAWGSDGGWIAVLALGIAARSIASGPARPDRRAVRLAFALLALTAGVRLLGRVLDVDQLGALALVVDAGAAGLLLAVDRRPWPVAPWALAGLVAATLPVEHVLQQLASYPLRIASAATVATVLAPLGVTREGTVLLGAGTPLHVDLPCSGATGLVALTVLGLVVACRRELGRASVLGALAIVGGAWLTNVVRLMALVLRPTDAWLEGAPHAAVGLAALVVGALPAALLARRLPLRQPLPAAPPFTVAVPVLVALAFTVVAALVLRAPPHPLDVSAPVDDVRLPGVIGPWSSVAEPLSPVEQAYYGTYGGSVERRVYDTGHTVLVVRTTAPLRHLHAPTACLQGSGHTVERVGVRKGVVPTGVWRATAPDGAVWRVETSFVSARGETADSSAEVAWRWLAHPGTAWMLVERVSPWGTCEADPATCASFDSQLLYALEASSPEVACSDC